jgi:ligand-binding sensor domain-containing protein
MTRLHALVALLAVAMLWTAAGDVRAGPAGPREGGSVLLLPLVGHYTRADLPAPLDRSWHHYGPTNTVRDVAVDPRSGAVWAATEGGLVRWDADAAISTRYSFQWAEHVAVDAAGGVWIAGLPYAAEERVSRLGIDKTWRHVTVARGLAAGRLREMAADPLGNMWLAYMPTSWSGGKPASGGLTRIAADGTVRTFGLADGWPSQSISSLAIADDGTVWFSFGQPDFDDLPSGVGRLAVDGTTLFELAPDELPAAVLLVQAVDTDGSVFAIASEFGSVDDAFGVLYRRVAHGGWSDVTIPDGVYLVRDFIKHVAVAPDGSTWVVDYAGMGVRLRPDGTWTEVPNPGADPELWFDLHRLSNLAFGPDGSAWFALGDSESGLVGLLPGDRWVQLRDLFGAVPGEVRHVAVDGRGDAWLAGGYGGLHQVSPAGTHQRHWSSDGSGSSLQPMAVDGAGNLWFAEGFSRRVWRVSADGRRRETLSLDGAGGAGGVHHIAVAPDGAVWFLIGTEVRWLGVDGQWRTLSITDGGAAVGASAIAFDRHGGAWLGFSKHEVLDPQTQRIVVLPGGATYVDTQGQLTTFRHDLLASHWLTALAVDPAGGLWVGTSAGLLRMAPDGTWSVRDLPSGPPRPMVRALAADLDGNVWIGTEEAGVHRLAPDGAWTSWDQATGLLGPTVWDILVDRRGDVWLAEGGDDRGPSSTVGGLQRMARDGTWSAFAPMPQPFESVFRSGRRGFLVLAQDAQGRILCGGWGDVVKRLEPDGTFTTLVPHDNLPNSTVNELVVDGRGEVWAATAEGIAHWTPADRWRTFNTADGLSVGSMATAAVDPSGALWVGMDPEWDAAGGTWHATGLARVTADGTVTRLDLPADRAGMGVHAIAFDRTGGLWVATHTAKQQCDSCPVQRVGTGVSHRDASGRWRHFGTPASVPLAEVRSILVDEAGAVWFATPAGLVQRTVNGRWETLTVEVGLASNEVRSLRTDADGRLWVATDAGVQRLDPQGGWRTWTVAEGLSDDHVHDLDFDALGRAWLGTRFGGVTVMPPGVE